jgi:hypothetical protein
MADSVGLGAPVAPASAVEHRLHTGTTVNPAQGRGEHSHSQEGFDEAPTQLGLGTIISAILRAPKRGGHPHGTLFRLRIVAPDALDSDLITGTVVDVINTETLLSTPIGLLALQRRLRLPPDSPLAFVVVETVLPGNEAALAPARDGSWVALEETLFALASRAPAVADELRDELTPRSGFDLAGLLLFLLSVLYRGRWPRPAITAALGEVGHGKLAQRLADDTIAMRKLSDDPSTGDWRVLTLPILQGNFPLSLRLYLNRRHATPEEGTRFALEVELSQLGPMQLDAMLRGDQIILVLRSHLTLEPELRQVLKAVFERALYASGLKGDISFVTAPQFLIRPLEQLREHIKITA